MAAIDRLQTRIEEFLTNGLQPAARSRVIDGAADWWRWEEYRQRQDPVPADTLQNRGQFVAFHIAGKAVALTFDAVIRSERARDGQLLSMDMDQEP